MHWWCTLCQQWSQIDNSEDSHLKHKEKIVGIRGDILVGYVNRMIWELKITNRLDYIK